MKVGLTYIDTESLTPQEIALRAKHLYGDSVQVKLEPVSQSYRDFIRHAISLAITGKQLDAFFDDEASIYEDKVSSLKEDFIEEVKELLDEITEENKHRWT